MKNNICGIIGLCTGWLMPISGFTLGIIALARGEKTKEIGIISIAISILAFFYWLGIYF